MAALPRDLDAAKAAIGSYSWGMTASHLSWLPTMYCRSPNRRLPTLWWLH